MDRHKDSWEAEAILTGIKLLGALPATAGSFPLERFSSDLAAVVTNVPGPCERRYLAGAPVDSIMAWVPKSGGVGLGVSFISYAGQARLGVVSDAGLVPDPEAIVLGFQAEFDALLAQAERVAEMISLPASLSMLDDALLTLEALLERSRKGPGRAAEGETATIEQNDVQ